VIFMGAISSCSTMTAGPQRWLATICDAHDGADTCIVQQVLVKYY